MASSRRWWARVAACLAMACVCLLGGAGAVLAHPLGNFTVNHYSRVELTGDTVRVRYVLDMAEIPSVQETRAADVTSDAYKQSKAAEILQQLDLTIDNQKFQLEPSEINVSQPQGQGDIHLVRLEAWLKAVEPLAANTPHQATFRDRSDPARIGWREVVVHAGPGATVSDSSVPAQDVSDELRSYPDNLLQSPLDRREARWTFTVDGSASSERVLATSSVTSRPSDPFAALVTAADLNPTVILLALAGAAILGGMHAASPGHGKSMMAAYIVGTHGTVLHAMALALSVTLSHTTGVLVLGLLTVVASNVIFPEQLYPWLTLVSGAVVLVVGARFLALALLHRGVSDHHHHHHQHNHDHGHADHDHLHHVEEAHARQVPRESLRGGEFSQSTGGAPPRGAGPTSAGPAKPALAPTWRSLFALGLAGGIVPSGSALVVLLSSVALGRLGFGLVLIVAFGLGMAIVLVTTGVLLVHAGRLMLRLFPDDDRSPLRQRISAAVPLVSATVMTLLGVVATFEGLSQIGAFRP
jgi:nickel/cobalt transporter (NicO) family protein